MLLHVKYLVGGYRSLLKCTNLGGYHATVVTQKFAKVTILLVQPVSNDLPCML